MNLETLFSAATWTAITGWLMLALLPRWRLSREILVPLLAIIPLGITYVALMVHGFSGSDGGYGSLAAVARLVADPALLLAGWLHWLAFDLFIGAWMLRDARAQGIAHGWVLPCLVLTFGFGPTGLLAYLALRAIIARRLALETAP